ncbi:MAG: Iturin A synthetase C [Parcubacteria group bacterium GW2011_GWB1_40_14]|nr:MAG: Iturin A synthetase C [Parcubacteria group bacterium GW2011_GWB1_40_14]
MRYLLHDVFTKTVESSPELVAITTEQGKSLTYRELNSTVNRYANYLRSIKPKEIREKPFVGILSAVNQESIAAVIGTLKAGYTYVPLDEYSPSERLAKILDNTKLEVIIIDPKWKETHAELLRHPALENVIFLGSETIKNYSDAEPPLLNQVSDDLAYILHSSGSTGVPKGIMLTHRNARTFIDWMQLEFKLTKEDVVMSRAPFKFDLSVFDIFNTFNAGATLVCFDWNKEREEENKHSDYVKLMEREKATIIYTTPSTFISMLNRGGLAEADLALREIMYAGEPFPTAQLRKLQEALPKTRIANIYGPTETNIITYYWVDSFPEDNSPIPLGYVVEDTEILIISEDASHICEPMEMGELWCRGGTVTLGYLGMEEKTKACLVDSPFHKYPVKFWRTGDFGFRDSDGLLHYKGRKDHMVKVKGYRIEIGEIESALAENTDLDEFVVVAVPDEKYGNRLYCFYTNIKGKTSSEEDVAEKLGKKIPSYMMPFRYIKKETLPKTSSEKVDRVLLAEEATNYAN